MPAIKASELRRMTESKGPKWVDKHIREALHEGQLRPEDFSIKELAEELVPDGREWVRSLGPQKSGGFQFTETADVVSTGNFANITGQVVFSKLMEGYSSEEFKFTALIPNVPTQFKGEKIPGVTAIGNMAGNVAEGAAYPFAGVSEEYIETPVTTKHGMIVPVTKEAIFFDRTGLVLQRASQVGESLGIQKEIALINCVIDENVTTHRYKRNGAAANATYQATTPWVNIQASNALVDHTDINLAEILLGNMTDPNTGLPMLAMADTLICTGSTAQFAYIATNAMSISLTSPGFATGSNPIQTHAQSPLGKTVFSQGTYQIVQSRLLAVQLATDTHWFLGNPRKAFAWMENWPITVVQAPSNSEEEFNRDIVLRFKASHMGAAATIEPRYMVQNTVA